MTDTSLGVDDREARVTPVADTDPATNLDATVDLVRGTYDFVMQADGYGLRRFTRTIAAGQTISRPIQPVTNVASSTAGAAVDGTSIGSMNASKLIDDTEGTNWVGKNLPGVSVDTVNRSSTSTWQETAKGRFDRSR